MSNDISTIDPAGGMVITVYNIARANWSEDTIRRACYD